MTIYVHFFLNNLYIFLWIHNVCLANTVFRLDPSNSAINRFWCIFDKFGHLQTVIFEKEMPKSDKFRIRTGSPRTERHVRL